MSQENNRKLTWTSCANAQYLCEELKMEDVDDLVKVLLEQPRDDKESRYPFFHEVVEQIDTHNKDALCALLKKIPIEIKADLSCYDRHGMNIVVRARNKRLDFGDHFYSNRDDEYEPTNEEKENWKFISELLAWDPQTETVDEKLIEEWNNSLWCYRYTDIYTQKMKVCFRYYGEKYMREWILDDNKNDNNDNKNDNKKNEKKNQKKHEKKKRLEEWKEYKNGKQSSF